FMSSAWFFDDCSGTECVQVLQYAGRALQLATDLASRERKRPEEISPATAPAAANAMPAAPGSPDATTRPSLEEPFLERLAAAKSNLHEAGDGRAIYERAVRPASTTWEKLGANYAVSSLFESYPQEAKLYCYTVSSEDVQSSEAGKAKLAAGRAKLTSEI